MSWGCEKTSVAFRPTEKAREAIKKLVTEKKAKNKSDAVNKLIDRGIQLEHPKGEDIFKVPPWMYCPQTRTYHLTETLLDPHNEVGCIKSTCKSQCRAWNNTGSLF